MARVSVLNPQKVSTATHASCPTLHPSSESTLSSECNTSCPGKVLRLPLEHILENPRLRVFEASPTSPVSPVQQLAVKALACLCSTTFFAVRCQTLFVAHTALAAAAHRADIGFAGCHAWQATNPSPKCKIHGLDHVIRQQHLDAYEKDICSWCDEMGAAELEEVAELADELGTFAGVDARGRERLLAWAEAFLRSGEIQHAWAHRYDASSRGSRRVRWAPHLVSFAEFSVEEDEHFKFQFVNVPGSDEFARGDSEIEDKCEAEHGSYGDCTSFNRQVSTTAWLHVLAPDGVDTDADADAGDSASPGAPEKARLISNSLSKRW